MFTDKEIQLIRFLLDYHLRNDFEFSLSAETAQTAFSALKKINYCIRLNKK